MYWLLKKNLKQVSRTLIKWRWTTDVELPETWETIDPPSESRFEDWHLDTMYKLSHFLGSWNDPYEPFGYLGLSDKTGKLISDQPQAN